jgi:hypothetical protein
MWSLERKFLSQTWPLLSKIKKKTRLEALQTILLIPFSARQTSNKASIWFTPELPYTVLLIKIYRLELSSKLMYRMFPLSGEREPDWVEEPSSTDVQKWFIINRKSANVWGTHKHKCSKWFSRRVVVSSSAQEHVFQLMSVNIDGGCLVVSVPDPYGRIHEFLDRSRYFFLQVAPQLYSRGWVDLAA